LPAQSKRDDIPVAKLPKEVRAVLDKYVAALNAPTLDSCATLFLPIAGGGLVNEDGTALGRDLLDFSLKKDFNNIKFYTQSAKITRVNVRFSNGDGYGASAIKGKVYKIWLGKKPGVAGMPAPVSIMVPEGHETIKTPKVIGIGSL
jgi:hypothetical protein